MDLNSKKQTVTKIALSATLISNVMAGASVFAEEAKPVQATDLNSVSANAKSAISELVQKGILEGDHQGNLNPGSSMTRLQAVALIGKALGLKVDNANASTFKDVSKDNWGLPYLEALAKIGVIEGDGNATFRPNDAITREELAAMFVRLTQAPVTGNGENLNVKDASSISGWAKGYVETALKVGLLSEENGVFGGKTKVTRETVAVAANNLISSPKFETYKQSVNSLFSEGKKISNSDPAI